MSIAQRTYPAVIKDDRLEWTGERPEYDPTQPLAIQIVVDEEAIASMSEGPDELLRRRNEALDRNAERGGLAQFDDPAT